MRWCQDTLPLDLARCADTGEKGTARPNPADIQQIEQLSLMQPREYTILSHLFRYLKIHVVMRLRYYGWA